MRVDRRAQRLRSGHFLPLVSSSFSSSERAHQQDKGGESDQAVIQAHAHP
jgi:hypothetical protein